jgi:hypothetical protein
MAERRPCRWPSTSDSRSDGEHDDGEHDVEHDVEHNIEHNMGEHNIEHNVEHNVEHDDSSFGLFRNARSVPLVVVPGEKETRDKTVLGRWRLTTVECICFSILLLFL